MFDITNMRFFNASHFSGDKVVDDEGSPARRLEAPNKSRCLFLGYG